MKTSSGVSGRFFSALGRANINVLAISQGSSERNISAVVATKNAARALRAVHSGNYTLQSMSARSLRTSCCDRTVNSIDL